ncbi:hypothetical protein [Rhabdothermincola salaria]|uniref:hypothetical protein n=1 Tax=Rhabdothermincola salaria TaxID=2903142 RepID=UPI001E36D72F|nr:hypothetical protein [Rhabdothermincola salaria]MCD9625385.1 hypothetical protein [Rhabdothermincola salaria]
MSLGDHGQPDTAADPRALGDDQIRLEMPADSRFARVARVAVSSLAVRLGFDVGVVEDLRIAVDEALVLLLRDLPGPATAPTDGPPVTVVMTLTARVPDLQVELRLDPPPTGAPSSDDVTDDDDPLSRFAELVPPRVTSSVTRHDGIVRLGLDD